MPEGTRESVMSSVRKVIGANARAIRLEAGATLQEVATACKRHGLPWSLGRVGDLESGRVAPSLPNILAFAYALSEFVPGGVSMADLLATDEPVEVNEKLTVPAETLAGFLTGRTVEADPPPPSIELARTEAELKIARDLGITIERLEEAMLELWGVSYTEERDRRAGERGSAQHRGQVGRRLREELLEAMN